MADEKTKADTNALSKQQAELEAMFAKVEGTDTLTPGMLKNLLRKVVTKDRVSDIMNQLGQTSGVMGSAGVSKLLKNIMRKRKPYEDRIMRIAKENSKKDGGRVTGKKVSGRLAKRGYGKARR